MQALETKEPLIQQVLTPEYAARFAYHSFRHSQGGQFLEGNIVSYVHTIRRSWTFTEQDLPQALSEFNKLLLSYKKMQQKGLHLSGTNETNEYGTKRAVDRAFYLMQRFLKGAAEPKPTIVDSIASGIIQQDHLFLTRPLGRNKKNPDIRSPLRDNWLSHAVHFGLNNNPTGLAEIDEMYRDVRAHILRGQLDPKSQKKFDEVLQIYKDKHPGVVINIHSRISRATTF